jgi:hypothetical protein
MSPRRLESALVGVATVLLGGQLLLLAVLRSRPEAPAELPELEVPPRNMPFVEEAERPSLEAEAVRVLDRLLADRLVAAVARTGVDPKQHEVAPELRAAALAAPDPRGPAVAALIDAYARALGALGESLDAAVPPTSSPAP